MIAQGGGVRLARPEDAPALLEIYAPYVTETVVSFEYQVPTVEEFSSRVKNTLARHPYLVWEEGGRVLGYAYAHPYAARPAYQWGAELTVYLHPEACRRGIGRKLYGALFDLLRLQGVRTVYGCITAENEASVAMHTALGFGEAGRFRNAGYKQGRWLDVLWLENFYQRIMMQKDPLALAYQAKHNCPDRTFARSAKENPKRTIYPGTDEPSDPSKRSFVGASLFLLAVAVVALLLLLTRNH